MRRIYGQIIHELPRAVLQARPGRDVRNMVQFARRSGVRIAARGQGHQPFGQAQVSRGVVIDMRSLRRIHAVREDRIDVDAGADWRTVLQATTARGLTPPVLASYLGLTVGGTLSIGGVGTATFRQGAQVDQVLELEVVTGAGRTAACSETRNRDLFMSALAGQGQCCIIQRAVLRLVRAPAMIREYVLQYSDIYALLEDQKGLIENGGFDGVVALLNPAGSQWTYSLVPTRGFSLPTIADETMLKGLRHMAGSERMRDVPYMEYADGIPNVEFGPARPDLGLLVPGSAAGAFLSGVLPRLTAEDLGGASGIRLFSWKRGSFTRPLFRIPAEDQFV